jgi:hypothetical protein
LESGNYIIGFYGIHAFFADIDSDRQYWRETGESGATETNGSVSVVHSILEYLRDEGFPEFMYQFNFEYSSALEWRYRFWR